MQLLRAFTGRCRESTEGARAPRAGGRKRKGARSPEGRPAGDVTARSALEFLAADDAERALVFALVHDPEFRLATALASSPEGATDGRVVRALLVLFEDYEDQLRQLLGLLMYREMADTYNWNELFRANSATTALLREYTCDLGAEFLSAALTDVLADLFEEDEEEEGNEDGSGGACRYEVNPRFLRPTDDLAGNQRRLEALADRVLDRLLAAAPLFPYQVAKIYRVLEVEMRRLLERDARLVRASSGWSADASQTSLLPRLSSFGRMDRVATTPEPSAGPSPGLSGTPPPSSSADEDPRASVGNASSKSLPRLSSIDEDLTDAAAAAAGLFAAGGSRGSNPSLLRASSSSAGAAAARDEFLLHLGGLLFLRFICPALVAPHALRLTPSGAPPSKRVHRALVLAAKLLQLLANGVEPSQARGELYMAPFAGFLARSRPRLARLYDAVCQQFEHDPRRESAISRSNQAPRLSQLWAHAGSSGSSRCSTCSFASSAGRRTVVANASASASASAGSAGNGVGAVDTREAALAVLRRWMRAHVELLASQVADNDKFQWQRKSVMAETGGTLKDGGGDRSAAERRRKPPVRTLKTSAVRDSAAGIPAAKIAEEEDAADAEEQRGGDELLQGSEAEDEALAAPGGGVSPAEFEALVGQTAHRDIQLLRVYYARVVARGLARLLRVNDAAHAREWALYKSSGPAADGPDGAEVQVFRRSRTLAGRGSKLVEMKAVARVRRPPRDVFAYLKSLERDAPSLHDASDGAAGEQLVREVEALDEAQAVLYRSCGKLSLWPAWLVKPRDSCDLHGFVERTGRADTFAVLLESVPRPDVPEVRGVVRMAFASGGLLVEPGEPSDEMRRMAGKQLDKPALTASATAETTASAETTAAAGPDEATEPTTLLTCVVRADFKGAMPRYLAESICFRQVMRVDAIRARVEAQSEDVDAGEIQGKELRTKKRCAAATEWV